MSDYRLVATTVCQALTSVAASVVLFQSFSQTILPNNSQEYVYGYIRHVATRMSRQLTMTIREYDGLFGDELYEAAEIYLAGKINPSTKKLRVSKPKSEKSFRVAMEKDEEVVDVYEGVKFKWRMNSEQVKNNAQGSNNFTVSLRQVENRSFELSFHDKYKDMVLGSYLPYVLEEAKIIMDEKKTVKLFAVNYDGIYETLGNVWTSVNFNHPSTFETLALDPQLKKNIISDLDGFVKRKEYYKRVGRAWKRGYLLYGPPGTGKSSLVAAMANYLNFDIYDLDLNQIRYNSELRKLMVATANRSILVVEDVDCSSLMLDREKEQELSVDDKRQVTLSGMLNSIDGLWSSCGDERIIVFTTNHKHKLDPALLRPGRMDVHIHMSYCTPDGFKVLASNYLQIQKHPLFENIENLMKNVEVTPAEVAEKLMKNDLPDIVIQELLDFLEEKKENST
ncbi:hypothetical protein IFM89_010730 [Coptis chinensis]|uniref:AAA+ ATPase domain-containing protein n=1 Tax=Coptis chinensis TaxID=261450 RepID=A0A835M5L4_9MAGN|nr:hypothetical protein IFM89_010730 [Coptis chinensis]